MFQESTLIIGNGFGLDLGLKPLSAILQKVSFGQLQIRLDFVP